MLEERQARGAVTTGRALRQRQLRFLRRGRLDEQQALRCEDLGQVLNQRVLQGRKPPVGRVDQHEIVAGACSGVVSQGGEGVLAEDGRVVEAELVEVAVDRAAGLAVVLYEGRMGGSARERLE